MKYLCRKEEILSIEEGFDEEVKKIMDLLVDIKYNVDFFKKYLIDIKKNNMIIDVMNIVSLEIYADENFYKIKEIFDIIEPYKCSINFDKNIIYEMLSDIMGGIYVFRKYIKDIAYREQVSINQESVERVLDDTKEIINELMDNLLDIKENCKGEIVNMQDVIDKMNGLISEIYNGVKTMEDFNYNINSNLLEEMVDDIKVTIEELFNVVNK